MRLSASLSHGIVEYVWEISLVWHKIFLMRKQIVAKFKCCITVKWIGGEVTVAYVKSSISISGSNGTDNASKCSNGITCFSFN